MVVYNEFHLNIKTDVDANTYQINSIAQTIEHQPSEFAGVKNCSYRYVARLRQSHGLK